MRLDEMILKANLLSENNGKTYFCNGTDLEYSKEKGFTGIEPSDQIRKFTDIVLVNEWEEKPNRHLTVSEAEKELGCVIDAPDISKLLRPMREYPIDRRNVIIVGNKSCYNTRYCGFCDSGEWRWFDFDKNPVVEMEDILHWIDPADLIKLTSKE